VISQVSDVGEFAHGMASFYDLLLKHTTGNFKDLLMGITLHPSMGIYLSHFNNTKTIPERNIHPDENYAREIMQLFSLGLYQLNMDGSLKGIHWETLYRPIRKGTSRNWPKFLQD